MTIARTDRHGAWSCFASALAERRVVVHETRAAQHLLLKPHLRATSLGDDVVVPPQSGDACPPRAALRLVVMRQLAGMATAAGHASRSPLWRRVFRTLELQRIDAAIARTYPGASVDLARWRAATLSSRPAAGPHASLRANLEALLQWALGAAPSSHDAVATAAQAAHDDASALHSAATATRICELLCTRWRARHPLHDRGAPFPLEANATTAGGNCEPPSLAMPNLALAGHAGATSSAGGAGPLAGDLADSATWTARASAALERTPVRARTRSSPRPLVPTRAHDTPGGRAHTIDEWDWRAQRFLPGWCTLYEQRSSGRDTRFIEGVRRRHAALAREVHRRFAALRPEALQRVHGAADGDELELDRVIEALVERRAGRPHDGALYLRRDRAQRDVCAVFLVDTSASTDFVLRDPTAPPMQSPPPSPQDDDVYLYAGALAQAAAQQPPPRRVIDVAKDALALMCDALQTLGDRFAVYAFSGHGRAQVEFYVVKAFDDAVSMHTAAALAALRPQGATRAGAAIRHASALLARQPQRHKVLIVVSDGYPEDIDYGPEPRELRYAIEDTAHALREAEASSISTFNLSIDPAGHDYLRRMCPRERYLVIDDVAALPGELTKVYQAMTRAAA
jgi:nitric oxide reductase NorD protein